MHTYFFSICLIFVGGFQLSHGQDECGLNEVRAECVNPCNTCEPTGRICNLACVPGCTCKPDHARNKSGVCIPRNQCKVSPEPKEADPNVPTRFGCPNVTACKQICRRRGFLNGTCIESEQPQCQCSDPIFASDGGETNNGGCPNVRSCTRNCQEKGFSSGTCSGRGCHCSKTREADVFDPTYPPINGGEFDSGGCPTVRRCTRSCRMRGFPGGVCVGANRRICRCTRHIARDYPGAYPPGKDVGPPRQYPLVKEGGGTDCFNGRLCESTCITLGFSHGTCIGGHRCKCTKIVVLPRTDDSGDGLDESDGCHSRSRCARSCIRRGYIGGICVGRLRRICRCIVEEEGGGR